MGRPENAASLAHGSRGSSSYWKWCPSFVGLSSEGAEDGGPFRYASPHIASNTTGRRKGNVLRRFASGAERAHTRAARAGRGPLSICSGRAGALRQRPGPHRARPASATDLCRARGQRTESRCGSHVGRSARGRSRDATQRGQRRGPHPFRPDDARGTPRVSARYRSHPSDRGRSAFRGPWEPPSRQSNRSPRLTGRAARTPRISRPAFTGFTYPYASAERPRGVQRWLSAIGILPYSSAEARLLLRRTFEPTVPSGPGRNPAYIEFPVAFQQMHLSPVSSVGCIQQQKRLSLDEGRRS